MAERQRQKRWGGTLPGPVPEARKANWVGLPDAAVIRGGAACYGRGYGKRRVKKLQGLLGSSLECGVSHGFGFLDETRSKIQSGGNTALQRFGNNRFYFVWLRTRS